MKNNFKKLLPFFCAILLISIYIMSNIIGLGIRSWDTVAPYIMGSILMMIIWILSRFMCELAGTNKGEEDPILHKIIIVHETIANKVTYYGEEFENYLTRRNSRELKEKRCSTLASGVKYSDIFDEDERVRADYSKCLGEKPNKKMDKERYKDYKLKCKSVKKAIAAKITPLTSTRIMFRENSDKDPNVFDDNKSKYVLRQTLLGFALVITILLYLAFIYPTGKPINPFEIMLLVVQTIIMVVSCAFCYLDGLGYMTGRYRFSLEKKIRRMNEFLVSMGRNDDVVLVEESKSEGKLKIY